MNNEKQPKATNNKKLPVKVICQSVYIGEKTISEIFFNILYDEVAKKIA